MKLAVIKCETASQKILEHYGDYDELIYSFLEQSNSNFDIETFDCKKIIFPTVTEIDNYDGFIISGSNSSVNDNDDWIKQLKAFIRVLRLKNKKVFGISFGNQIISSAFGGVVSNNPK